MLSFIKPKIHVRYKFRQNKVSCLDAIEHSLQNTIFFYMKTCKGHNSTGPQLKLKINSFTTTILLLQATIVYIGYLSKRVTISNGALGERRGEDCVRRRDGFSLRCYSAEVGVVEGSVEPPLEWCIHMTEGHHVLSLLQTLRTTY